MLAAVRLTVSLLKLRIGIAIAASALAGIAATNGPAPSSWRVAAVALAVLGASGAAGAFNHYYERDLDRLMRRTRGRPFATGAFQPGWWWLAGFIVLLAASLALAASAGGGISAAYVFLGAFTYGIVYTVWLKRRSAWNIVVGGWRAASPYWRARRQSTLRRSWYRRCLRSPVPMDASAFLEPRGCQGRRLS